MKRNAHRPRLEVVAARAMKPVVPIWLTGLALLSLLLLTYFGVR